MQIPNKINIGDKIGVISTARKISLEELVAEMIKHDRQLAIKDNLLKNKGYDLTFPRD